MTYDCCSNQGPGHPLGCWGVALLTWTNGMQVMMNHLVPGDLTAAAITDKLGAAGGSIIVQTLLDQEVYVTTTESGLTIQSWGLEGPAALVLTADAMSCVGPIHVVDALLLPDLWDGLTDLEPRKGLRKLPK